MTQTHEIEQNVGIDGARLGDRRSDVRDCLGEFRTFTRGRECDQFISSGLMVSFDENDRAVMIEIPEGDWGVAGVKLLGRKIATVKADLAAVGVELVQDESGGIISGWDVALWAPSEEIEGIQIGS